MHRDPAHDASFWRTMVTFASTRDVPWLWMVKVRTCLGVVDVTVLKHRRPDANSRPAGSARAAWIAVALVPVGLALGVAAGFLGGESGGGGAGALLPSLLSLAAPTAAVILAVRAARAGLRSARTAVVVAGLLLVGTFVWLPLIVISIGTGWIIALVVVVGVLGVFEWRSRNKPLPPA